MYVLSKAWFCYLHLCSLSLSHVFSLCCSTTGGMKEIALHTNRQYVGGLVGCVSHFTLSTDFHLALVEDAADGKNINTCSNWKTFDDRRRTMSSQYLLTQNFFSFWQQTCEKHFCCCTRHDLKTKTQTGKRPVAVSSSHGHSHYKCSAKASTCQVFRFM